MNNDRYDYIAECEMMDDFMEREMHKVRDSVLEKLSSIFVHGTYLNQDIALTLAYGYFDSHQPSINIADTMNFGKFEFLAIMEDLDAFKEEYLKNYEEAQNF
jgi:hypothetical protein